MNKIIDIKKLSHEGRNIRFTLLLEGFYGAFRIHYQEEKTTRYTLRTALTIYFEPGHNETYVSKEFGVPYVTDAMLFAERYKQWLLEDFFRKFE